MSNNEIMQSLFIAITMSYSDPATSTHKEMTFYFFNSNNIEQATLDTWRIRVMKDGDIIAPYYGLPQLAPVDHPEETTSINHPYSEIVSIKVVDNIEDEDGLVDINEIMPFDDIEKVITSGNPTPGYIEMRRHFLKDRIAMLQAEIDAATQELDDKYI